MLQILLAVCTQYIRNIDLSDQAARIDVQCYGLVNVLYLFYIMHVINAFTAFVCLVGLDKIMCSGIMMLIFLVANIVTLAWGQSTYFKSMRINCLNMVPAAYLWSMFETLFFYIMITVIICYFFRKYCQDPKLVKEEEKERKEEIEEMALDKPDKPEDKDIAHGTPVDTHEQAADVEIGKAIEPTETADDKEK